MAARTIPTLPTWTAGMRVTGAYLAAMVAYQQFWADPPMFRMRQTIAQSIPSTSTTIVTMDTSEYDTDSGRAAGTPWAYTIPVGMSGRWQFTVHVPLPATASTERDGFLMKNGSAVTGGQVVLTTAGPDSRQLTITVPCAAGDVMAAAAFQQSGGAVNTVIGATIMPTFEGRLISLANP